MTVSAESVTIGTADNCDIQLRQFLDSFLFEIKYSEDSWWIVNPLRTPHLLINGNAIELEAKLHAEDEIQIEGHKLKTAIKKLISLKCRNSLHNPRAMKHCGDF